MNKNGIKFGFTLAEVLITLVIIGVIAALTIPALINKTQNQELVSKLKKTYSTLSQTTNLIISEHGSAENWVTSGEDLYNIYKKHLSISMDCGSNRGCFEQASEVTDLQGRFRGYYSDFNTTNGMRFILSDGTLIRFPRDYVYPACDYDDNGRSANNCALIMVDINGGKKPNQIGRDIFFFTLKSGGLYPRGCDSGSIRCKKGGDNVGDDCACKVILENAINY